MSDEDVLNLFRRRGLKVTPQRLAIFRALINSRKHPSSENLFRRVRKYFPGISFDTVNRSLITFADLGLIRVVEGYGVPKRYDPDLSDHGHFWCLRCNRIIDLNIKCPEYSGGVDSIEGGHHILRSRLVLEGICRDCQKNVDSSGSGAVSFGRRR